MFDVSKRQSREFDAEVIAEAPGAHATSYKVTEIELVK